MVKAIPTGRIALNGLRSRAKPISGWRSEAVSWKTKVIRPT
jgi:hypothetical protein